MEIQLDLSKHCIKTEIQRQYDKSISEYFKTGETYLEDKIEFLKNILENIDLIGLRGRYQDLAGNSDAEVKLVLHGDGLFELKLDRATVHEGYLPQVG